MIIGMIGINLIAVLFIMATIQRTVVTYIMIIHIVTGIVVKVVCK